VTETESYVSLIGIIIFAIATTIAAKMLIKSKGKVLLFFFLAWLVNAIYFVIDYLSITLGLAQEFDLSVILFKIEYSIFFSIQLLFWLIFIDYAQHDELGWKKMSLGIGVLVIIFVWVWRPENTVTASLVLSAAEPTLEFKIPSEGFFNYLVDAFIFLFAISFLYWSALTNRAAPEVIKKRSLAMFIAGILLFACSLSFIPIDSGLIDPNSELAFYMSTLTYIFLLASIIISTIVIYKEPKIIHLLPYKVYRLFISSKAGTVLRESLVRARGERHHDRGTAFCNWFLCQGNLERCSSRFNFGDTNA